MYDFGFFAAAYTGLSVFSHAARRSGPTTPILDRMQDGDILVIGKRASPHWFRDQLKRRRIKGEIWTGDWASVYTRARQRAHEGRIWFDHTWVQEYYFNALEQAQKDFQRLAQRAAAANRPDPREKLPVDVAWPVVERSYRDLPEGME